MLHPIDVINKNNQLTGEVSNPEEANHDGLWHRGVHVVLYTPSRKILVQKRSSTLVQNPGKLEISVGGFVDSGETPEEAVLREVREETGINATPGQLAFLGLSHYNHRWKFEGKTKISRVILYNYAIRLSGEPEIISQREEVEWAKFIPLASAQWLVRRGSLKKLGFLTPTYAHYRKLLQQTIRTMRG